MCGIAGIVAPRLGRLDIGVRLAKMWPGIAARGPDGHGQFVDNGVGLLHSRLKIIDLEAGAQPLWNEHRDVACVFNGEIYGYRRIQAQLRAGGHRLSSTSDTEVLVHLYEDYGEAFTNHIHGMYAIAIWDARARKVTIARDRLGIKPLYVADLPEGGLAFSSSISSLLSLDISADPDIGALADYYRYGKISEPSTAYRAIRTLLPGSRLQLDIGSSAKTTTKFYSLPRASESPCSPRLPDDAIAQAREAFERAVASHLDADVEVGAFLSGGIDSSLVVAQAQRLSSRPLRTFCARFSGDQKYDETTFAETVANALGTRHETIDITAPPTDLIAHALRAAGQPFSIASFLPMLLLCREAAKQIKVVLTGDGGDEVGYGYEWYKWAQWTHRGHSGALADCMERGLRSIEVRAAVRPALRPLRRALRFARGALSGGPRASDAWRHELTRGESLRLLRREFREQIAPETYLSPAAKAWDRSLTPRDAMRRADMEISLRDEMLPKLDGAGMAHGLEGRVPLLDDEFVDAMLRLPAEVHMARGRPKALLRRWAAELCPGIDLERPKHGFNVPMSDWLKTSLFCDVRRLLLEPGRPGLVEPAAARDLWLRMKAGVPGAGHAIYSLLMGELWFERRTAWTGLSSIEQLPIGATIGESFTASNWDIGQTGPGKAA